MVNAIVAATMKDLAIVLPLTHSHSHPSSFSLMNNELSFYFRSKSQSFVFPNNGVILPHFQIHIQDKRNFQYEQTVKPRRGNTHTHTQKNQLRFGYSQVLGFLLLCAFGANLAATGGSGAQLRGDEGEHTLHHPPSVQKEGPAASSRHCS